MPTESSTAASHCESARAFATTHWSVVLAAGRNDTGGHHALSKLCQSYWYPLYAYARRRGHSPHDAQDLTQEFFAQLLARQSFAAATPSRGRFRSFLLTSMNHFLVNEWKKARAQKRGGGEAVLSLDLAAAEQRYDLEPADQTTPDKAYDRHWALTLLEEVLTALEKEYRQSGKTELFAALKQSLMGSRETQPYAELAAKLAMSEVNVKVAVHRLRKRYRELIRAEIAQTVASPDEVNDEMRHLLSTLS